MSCRILIWMVFSLPLVSYAQQMSQMQFPIKKDGKWGFINASGDIIIAPQYLGARLDMYPSIHIVKDSTGYFIINTLNEPLFNQRYQSYTTDNRSRLINFENKEGKWGTLNSSGEQVIEFIYTRPYYFCDGIAVIQEEGGKRGFLDTNGTFISVSGYDGLIPNNEGFMTTMVKSDGKKLYGLYNTTTKQEALEPQFKSIHSVKNGHVIVQLENNGQGIIDVNTGDFLLKPRKGKRRYAISTSRYLTSDAVAVNALQADDLYMVSYKNWFGKKRKYSMTSKGDKMPEFFKDQGAYFFSDFFNGKSGFSQLGTENNNKNHGLISIDGEVILEATYDWVGISAGGITPVEISGKWGYCNDKGKEVTPLIFDKAFYLIKELAMVFIIQENTERWWDIYKADSDVQMGYVNHLGEIVWPAQN